MHLNQWLYAKHSRTLLFVICPVTYCSPCITHRFKDISRTIFPMQTGSVPSGGSQHVEIQTTQSHWGLPWRDVWIVQVWQMGCHSSHMSCLCRSYTPHSPFPPLLLQIYNQTDGIYMGSPEMSPLYSIVNALTQSGHHHHSHSLPSLVAAPLVSPSSLPVCHLSISFCLLPSPPSNKHAHTLVHSQSRVSHFETPTHSPLFLLIMHRSHPLCWRIAPNDSY